MKDVLNYIDVFQKLNHCVLILTLLILSCSKQNNVNNLASITGPVTNQTNHNATIATIENPQAFCSADFVLSIDKSRAN